MDGPSIPVGLRVHLAHASVQALGSRYGIDLLHVKGPALDEALRPRRPTTNPQLILEQDDEPVPRLSTDADVLVRPSQVDSFLTVLQRHGWDYVTRFSTGSAFEHAASLWHDDLGYVDVHRHFPGIELTREEAFDELWSSRHVVRIAHQPCFVPSLDLQRLLLILHGAREGGLANPDVELVWTRGSQRDRDRTQQWAAHLRAEVALAAATGHLDQFRKAPSHDLWHLFSTQQHESRLAEWKARYRAAPTTLARARVIVRSLIVNTDHLAMEWGRKLTPGEVAKEYGRRACAFGREVLRAGHGRIRNLRRSSPPSDRRTP